MGLGTGVRVLATATALAVVGCGGDNGGMRLTSKDLLPPPREYLNDSTARVTLQPAGYVAPPYVEKVEVADGWVDYGKDNYAVSLTSIHAALGQLTAGRLAEAHPEFAQWVSSLPNSTACITGFDRRAMEGMQIVGPSGETDVHLGQVGINGLTITAQHQDGAVSSITPVASGTVEVQQTAGGIDFAAKNGVLYGFSEQVQGKGLFTIAVDDIQAEDDKGGTYDLREVMTVEEMSTGDNGTFYLSVNSVACPRTLTKSKS